MIPDRALALPHNQYYVTCAAENPDVGGDGMILAACGPEPKQLKSVWEPEMVRYWHPTRNGALTPEEVQPGSNRHLWWRCEHGHEWQARAFSVKAGCGCPYCAGKLAIPGETDLATLRPELMAQWDFEKNTVDPAEITVGAHDMVWWKCALGHSWQAVVFSRTKVKGTGCPYCTGRLVLPGFNDVRTLRPQLAEQWYQPLNGALKPENVTLGSNKKVWWQCGEGHVWCAAIFARTRARGTGCPVCAGRTKGYKREA